MPDRSHWLAPGIHSGDAPVAPLNPDAISEQVAYSWFKPYLGGKHPFEGETVPDYQPDSARYSWIKAPRYDGRAMQTGPLADLMVDGDPLAVNGYETEAKTAQQLAAQELTGTNWRLDWPLDFPDWLAPARTFNYIQKTLIEVIGQIVGTASGRILADATLDWIRVRPRHPHYAGLEAAPGPAVGCGLSG